MEVRKFRGIIREPTLRRMIDDKDCVHNVVDAETKQRMIETKKSKFEITRRNARYYNVHQVFGVKE